MRQAYDDADTAFQNSRIVAAAAAGIWGIAVLDWLIFAPPARRLSRTEPENDRLRLAVRPGQINRVGLNLSF